MPFTEKANVKLFISHASEDTRIAEAIAQTMRSCFTDDFEITMMSEFPAGVNWRKLIVDNIKSTDVLLAVATGRLKPSHSFTGMEVGSFLTSIDARPKMSGSPEIERRMIPFAILAKTPDPISSFQGIDIDANDLFDFRFDEDDMEGQLHELSDVSLGISADNKVYKLLIQLENIRTQYKKIALAAGPEILQRDDLIRHNARLLCGKLLEIMSNKEQFVHTPEAKLIIRIPPPRQGEDIDIERASITIEGDCAKAFGFIESEIPALDWHKFVSKTNDNTAGQWKRALSIAVSSSVTSNVINDNYVLSYDQKKCFRIFSAKYIQYYNKFSETEVYVVEMLKPRSYGDQKINLSIKGLEMAFRYRFMFLEQEESQFSPIKFDAMGLDEVKRKAAEMLDELNLLIWESEEYGLDAPEAIITLLGAAYVPKLNDLRQEWDRQKRALYAAAVELLGKKELTYPDKDKFSKAVEMFCKSNEPTNRQYIETVFGLFSKCMDEHKLLPTASGANTTAGDRAAM